MSPVWCRSKAECRVNAKAEKVSELSNEPDETDASRATLSGKECDTAVRAMGARTVALPYGCSYEVLGIRVRWMDATV